MVLSDTPDTTARCLSVRFEDTCILIPSAYRVSTKPLRPRIVTKSYSLPLWKPSPSKKVHDNFQSLVSEVNKTSSPEAERKAFNLTVSVPRLAPSTCSNLQIAHTTSKLDYKI